MLSHDTTIEQCVFPVARGHVSVALEPTANLPRLLNMLEAALSESLGAT